MRLRSCFVALLPILLVAPVVYAGDLARFYEMQENEWLFVCGVEYRYIEVVYDTEKDEVLVNGQVFWRKSDTWEARRNTEDFIPSVVDSAEVRLQEIGTIYSCMEHYERTPSEHVDWYFSSLGKATGYSVHILSPGGRSYRGSKKRPLELVHQLQEIIRTKQYEEGPVGLRQMLIYGFEVEGAEE